jgi:CBS domain-containing protein
MATVGDWMSRELLFCEASATVGEAASLMAQRHVGSVLVLAGGRLAGIFTERDIVRAVSHDVQAGDEPVEDWFTRDPRTVTPEVSIDDAREVMLAGHFRHLPVTDGPGGEVIGMLSMRDIARSAAGASRKAAPAPRDF